MRNDNNKKNKKKEQSSTPTKEEEKEFTTGDVNRLLREGYYTLLCEVCTKPLGYMRPSQAPYDYASDESLCMDCAYAKAKSLGNKEMGLYS